MDHESIEWKLPADVWIRVLQEAQNYYAAYFVLRVSKRMRSLSVICVKENRIKMPTKDHAEVYQFMAQNGYINCIIYMLENGSAHPDVTVTAAAALGGQLSCLKYLHKHGCSWNETAMMSAARSGSISCLQYMHEEGLVWTSAVSAEAALNDQLECLTYLHVNGCPCDKEVTEKAATGRSLRCLKYALDNGFGCDSKAPEQAALKGSLECLQLLRSYGCEWEDISILIEAASSGNLACVKFAYDNMEEGEILKFLKSLVMQAVARSGSIECTDFLIEKGFTWPRNFCSEAAGEGHFDLVQHAHRNGCQLDDGVCDSAASQGRIDIIEYALAKGCKLTEYACEHAARNNDLSCLKYLRSKGCPWDESSCASAAQKNHFEVLKYLHENGCPWNEDTTLNAMDNAEMLKYVVNSGCPIHSKCLPIAALKGDLDTTKFLIEHGAKFSTDITVDVHSMRCLCCLKNEKFKDGCDVADLNAALRGHLHVLKYIHEQGGQWHPMISAFAALSGKTEVLEYLVKTGCLLDTLTCHNASLSGHLDLLKYAHEHGFPWHEGTCISTAVANKLDCLKYAVDNGAELLGSICTNAIRYGASLEMIKYLHELGCTWNYYSSAAAARIGALEMLKYLVENGCEVNGALCWNASRYNHHDIVAYAHEKGLPCAHNSEEIAQALEKDPNVFIYFM